MNKNVLVIFDKFECLKIAHIEAVKKAAQFGGKVTVAIPTEDSKKSDMMNNNSAHSNEKRLFLATEIKGVDEVCVYESLEILQASAKYDMIIQI